MKEKSLNAVNARRTANHQRCFSLGWKIFVVFQMFIGYTKRIGGAGLPIYPEGKK
jgi:hypothetical protein